VATSRFLGSNGKVEQLECIRLDSQLKPMAGTEFNIPADLVLLAMGFLHPVQEGMVEDLRLELDPRGNVRANEQDYRTSRSKIFAAGDMRRGQSLVVWAIREGRQAAHAIDKFLMGKTDLPR
jgi:glutamate synthase (NADPH/NADH) small chain